MSAKQEQGNIRFFFLFDFFFIAFPSVSPKLCGVNLQVYLENCLFLGSFQIEQL